MKNRFLFLLSFVAFLSNTKSLIAQSDFYAVEHIPEIRVYFTQSNWDEVLDSLYIQGELERLGANVVIDGVEYKNVGVRYKGFSSYSSIRNKNPLNIDLDYIYDNQNHQGFKKIKLSNVIQDPSFVREVLSYEIARKYMPASRANYANVYINDTLIGVYTNVEAVDDDFLLAHFGTDENTFVKCNPESLDLNGENANLSNTLGSNIADYATLYRLKSDDDAGWYELKNLIDTLNDAPSNVQDILNVDRTLWMHAFNYAVINFDSYVGYAQNYYLYQDDNGQFNPILWDLNMSFASYRLTDASDYWDGFTIAEAKIIDPLEHLNSFSVQPRPLIRNLLINDTYKRMYLAHLRTIMEENFDNMDYASRVLYLQNIVDQSVQNDTNKFYSYTDFIDNYNTTVTDLVDYPGITELMNDRATYISTYPGIQGAPSIYGVTSYPPNTTTGDDVWINASVTGAPINVLLAYRLTKQEAFTFVAMVDDGTMNDGVLGDGLYGAKIEDIGYAVEYYVYAENDTVGRFSPERAAYEFYEIISALGRNELVINEVKVNNTTTGYDQEGEYDNWIELHNNSNYQLSTAGLFLSNEQSNLTKWEFPLNTIEAGEHLIVWTDGDTLQSGYHANFEFEVEGDSLWLSYADGTIIDSVIFGAQQAITSYGRYPNGTGNFRELLPTIADVNRSDEVSVLSDAIFIYPNPASTELYIRINTSDNCDLALYTMDGRLTIRETSLDGNSTFLADVSSYATGIYLLQATINGESHIKKIMITH